MVSYNEKSKDRTKLNDIFKFCSLPIHVHCDKSVPLIWTQNAQICLWKHFCFALLSDRQKEFFWWVLVCPSHR